MYGRGLFSSVLYASISLAIGKNNYFYHRNKNTSFQSEIMVFQNKVFKFPIL